MLGDDAWDVKPSRLRRVAQFIGLAIGLLVFLPTARSCFTLRNLDLPEGPWAFFAPLVLYLRSAWRLWCLESEESSFSCSRLVQQSRTRSGLRAWDGFLVSRCSSPSMALLPRSASQLPGRNCYRDDARAQKAQHVAYVSIWSTPDVPHSCM